jgi:hypothetical protein
MMNELQRVLEWQVGKFSGRVLGYPERSTLDGSPIRASRF